MRETILERFSDLTEDLFENYDKVYIIDDYDFYESNPYTIFYISKKDNFNDFEEMWENNVKECREKDYSYDDIADSFYKKARDKFDYVELGTLNIYTDKEHTLYI